jgi:hypothetical protein
MRDSDVQREINRMIESRKYDYPEDKWFDDLGHWIIRKVPNTKDQFYVAVGNPTEYVLGIYGIR